LHTSFPERFAERRDFSGLATDGSRCQLRLEDHWFHKGTVILKFFGLEGISDAERLTGMELQIPAEQRTQLKTGEAYVSDLVGCSVVTGGFEVGVVADVQFGAGEAPLLVLKRGTEEFLVPYAGEFLRKADLETRRIEVELPEGLLELQSPLSVEEKHQQKLEAEEVRRAGERRKK
jgi:16S rRNA processing protein RimM